jgi:hypothetical protein
VAYNFETRNSKIKLITEFENVTQKSFIWQRYTHPIDVGEKV